MAQSIVRLPLTASGLQGIKESWDLTNDELGRLIGTTGRTIIRYLNGEAEIPPATQMLLLLAEAMPHVAIGMVELSRGASVDVQGHTPMKRLLKANPAS